MAVRTFRLLFLLLAVALPAAWLYAQTKSSKSVKRAQLPKLEASGGPFFSDAFQQLVGERPADLGKPAVAASTGGSAAPSSSGSSSGGGLAGSGWAAIISSTTIEDEIKSLKSKIDAEITTPSDFNGKGYKLARRDFSVLAMLFGIIGEYDGDVRFKTFGPGARDTFARSAANTKVGTSQSFTEAKLRKSELQDVIGGANPFSGKEAEAKAVWNTVCDRSPLMMHLEDIFEPRVKAWTADKAAFNSNDEKLLHEAEMISAIGAVLAKEGMEDSGADDYKGWCQQMTQAGRAIVEAIKTKNYEAATAAAGEISKARDNCHGTYR
jgi:hypothetical protein